MSKRGREEEVKFDISSFLSKKKKSSKISKFDKASCQEIRDAMNTALKSVQEQYGIKIHVGNASFTDVEITFKCKCKDI